MPGVTPQSRLDLRFPGGRDLRRIETAPVDGRGRVHAGMSQDRGGDLLPYGAGPPNVGGGIPAAWDSTAPTERQQTEVHSADAAGLAQGSGSGDALYLSGIAWGE